MKNTYARPLLGCAVLVVSVVIQGITFGQSAEVQLQVRSLAQEFEIAPEGIRDWIQSQVANGVSAAEIQATLNTRVPIDEADFPLLPQRLTQPDKNQVFPAQPKLPLVSRSITNAPIVNLSVMPVGDSITAGISNHSSQADRASYRPWLYDTIDSRTDVQNGALNLNFVGINPHAPTDPIDGTERPTGYLSTQDGGGGFVSRAGNGSGPNPLIGSAQITPNYTLAQDANTGTRGFESGNFVPSELAAFAPDVALIMLGTNDIINSELFGNGNYDNPGDVNSTRDNLIDLIDAFQGANPDVAVLVGTIPTMYWYVDPDQTDVELGGYVGPDNEALDANNNGSWEIRYEGDENGPLNDMIRSLGVDAFTNAVGSNNQSTGSSQVIIVDHVLGVGNGAFVGDPSAPGGHTVDGVHPNLAGDQLLADNWYLPLNGILTAKVAAAVPEPSSFLFLGMILGLAGARRRFVRRDVVG